MMDLSVCGQTLLVILAVTRAGADFVSESYSSDFDTSPPTRAIRSTRRSASTSNVERAIVLSREQSLAIVQRHNELRTIVKPSATKMRKFTWNQELADVATTYTRKCIYEHNKARKHSRFSYIGENLYISMRIPWSTNLVTNAVSAWDAEKEDYDYRTRKCKPGKKCGHYTQTAWDDTFKVGCGVTICRRIPVNGRIWKSATLFACNYGPGGNFPRHPFASGPSCSNCDAGDVCVDNLCTNRIRDVDFDTTVGQWGAWSQWSTCSKTCIGGSARRERKCNTFTASDCKGYSIETTFGCATDFCNANFPGSAGNGEYHPWGAWSKCSVSCGDGRKTRTRRCKTNSCTGYNRMTFACNEGTCPTGATRPTPRPRGTWSSWGKWGSCSVTCGVGQRRRRRRCRGSNCLGRAVLTGTCNAGLCEGVWTRWSSWSSCTVTCGGGSRVRGRRCNTGSNCIGASEASELCNTARCQGIFSPWSLWSQCSTSCGRGVTVRSRTCPTGNCKGRKKHQKACNEGQCPEFNKWTSWSSCDVTCGSGSRNRTRSCNSGNSNDCDGQSSQIKTCILPECQNPGWNFWSAWNSCNVTCGTGWRTSNRTCHGGVPGSKVCPGDFIREQRCQRKKCPEFSRWSEWSECSATCGRGLRTRQRSCRFGRGCVGDYRQEQTCTAGKCTLSKWSEWEKWSKCSESCGEGIHTRTRYCLVGTTGLPCSGASDDSRTCNLKSCQGGNHAAFVHLSQHLAVVAVGLNIWCARL